VLQRKLHHNNNGDDEVSWTDLNVVQLEAVVYGPSGLVREIESADDSL